MGEARETRPEEKSGELKSGSLTIEGTSKKSLSHEPEELDGSDDGPAPSPK